MPFSLRAKRKRRSNLSDRCTLDNKSTTSVRRGANLSRSDTHCHPRRLGSSATSLRQPETSAQVFFPQHSNILHWSNILKPKFSWLRFQKFTFPIPIGVTSLARGLACLLQLKSTVSSSLYLTSLYLALLYLALRYLTPMDCHLLSPPFHISIFHSAVDRHLADTQLSVCRCTLPTLVVARFMLGWPQAESLQLEFRWGANLVVVRQEFC